MMKSKNRLPQQYFIVVSLLLLILGGCGGAESRDSNLPASGISASTVEPSPTQTVAATVEAFASPVLTATETVMLDDPATNVDVGSDIISGTSYPAPIAAASPTPIGDYPPPVATIGVDLDAYPAPQTLTPETSRIPIVPFVLQRPLKAGDTVVSGSGPANVPILVVDLFLMGEILGSGMIDESGNFEVTVPALETGHWIGVALDDLSNTGFEFEDFYARGFRGQGAEQVPQVGFVYDSDYVQ